ncbi:hypothetical protein HAX54_022521, partial [Datura stramonium]|nr:hypothetical protein [Datura stramonium]
MARDQHQRKRVGQQDMIAVIEGETTSIYSIRAHLDLHPPLPVHLPRGSRTSVEDRVVRAIEHQALNPRPLLHRASSGEGVNRGGKENLFYALVGLHVLEVSWDVAI